VKTYIFDNISLSSSQYENIPKHQIGNLRHFKKMLHNRFMISHKMNNFIFFVKIKTFSETIR